MKSDKAEDYLINHECGYPMDGYVPLMEAGRAVVEFRKTIIVGSIEHILISEMSNR